MANSSKNYKLLVADFDGTLAGVDHVVTPKVSRAVKKWIDSGRHFTIATGRSYLMIIDECKKMNLSVPVIVRGGAEVVDPVSDKLLNSEYMSKVDIKKILGVLQKNNLNFLIEKDDVLYSNFRIELVFPTIKYKNVSEFKISDAPKILVKANENNHKEVQMIMDEIENRFNKINIARNHGEFGYGWDVTSVRATKLHGIVKVMEYLNVDREQIVGVGDSYNDFPLLAAAGLKVAMGNANEDLKAIADMKVPSHEDDGVAYLIDKLLQ